MAQIRVPRLVIGSKTKFVEIHGFADSSEVAYSACLYIQSIDDKGKIFVQLLCSHSTVAPLKSITVPRLQFCAAILLIDLVRKTHDSINFKINKYALWSDSTITFSWIKSEPKRWKTFVCNRVVKYNTIHKDWYHVSRRINFSRSNVPIYTQLKLMVVWPSMASTGERKLV